jgi:hypothetical protein
LPVWRQHSMVSAMVGPAKSILITKKWYCWSQHFAKYFELPGICVAFLPCCWWGM